MRANRRFISIRSCFILVVVILLSSCYREVAEFESRPVPGNEFPDYESYYWYKGEKVPLQENSDKIYVMFRQADIASVRDVLRETRSGGDAIDIEDYEYSGIDASAAAKDSFRDIKWSIIEGAPATKASLKTSADILYMSPFYKSSLGGGEIGISNLFYVKLKDESGKTELENMASENGVKVLGNNMFLPLWYTLACDNTSSGDALAMANLFYETGRFEASEPDIMVDLSQNVNDTYFNQQWNLQNTGQHGGTSGMDINFVKARELSTGSSNITVAVIDQGIDKNHSDITNLHSVSWDASGSTSPSRVHGNHGTACAGIIGAKANNRLGVAGIAPGVTLMDISHNLLLAPNAAQELANGILYATIYGASVMSNSWGHESLTSTILDNSIQYALVNGRGGKGCVMVFSSGNDNLSTVLYPARTHPDIIAVGAATLNGGRKTPSSIDGEYRWGSSYGTALDVVAPGVLIPTTDRVGLPGYSTTDYTMNFNGTSAACPHVAGVAALILSMDNTLTQRQVGDIIERTARKVPGYSYSITPGRNNGTWNQEVGYGFLDAYAALRDTRTHISYSEPVQRGVPFTAKLNYRGSGTVSDVEWIVEGIPGDEETIIEGQGTERITLRFDWAGYRTVTAYYRDSYTGATQQVSEIIGYAAPDADYDIIDAGTFDSDFTWSYAADSRNTFEYLDTTFEITRPMWILAHNFYSGLPGTYLLLFSDDYETVYTWDPYGENDHEIWPDFYESIYVPDYYGWPDSAHIYRNGNLRIYLQPGLYHTRTEGRKVSNAGTSEGIMRLTVKGFVEEPPQGTI